MVEAAKNFVLCWVCEWFAIIVESDSISPRKLDIGWWITSLSGGAGAIRQNKTN